MPDLEQLRRLSGEVRPPAFESLEQVAGRRDRRATVSGALASVAAVVAVVAGGLLVVDPGEDRPDPAPFVPTPTPHQAGQDRKAERRADARVGDLDEPEGGRARRRRDARDDRCLRRRPGLPRLEVERDLPLVPQVRGGQAALHRPGDHHRRVRHGDLPPRTLRFRTGARGVGRAGSPADRGRGERLRMAGAPRRHHHRVGARLRRRPCRRPAVVVHLPGQRRPQQ